MFVIKFDFNYLLRDDIEAEQDSWRLSKINESLLNKALQVGLNSEVNSNIDLDSNNDGDSGDFSPTDGSDYEPEDTVAKKKKVFATLTNVTEINLNEKEVGIFLLTY